MNNDDYLVGFSALHLHIILYHRYPFRQGTIVASHIPTLTAYILFQMAPENTRRLVS